MSGPAPLHVAVASALSPRFRPVLSEAWRVAQTLGASRFSILHVGPRSPEAEAEFTSAQTELSVSGALHWGEGDPAEALLHWVEALSIDLLVAGALERDLGPHFLSSVARSLLHGAHCSVLLLTNPELPARPFRRIVAITDYSPAAHHAFRVALSMAEREQAEVLYVLSVFTPFTAARAALGAEEGPAHDEDDAHAMLDDFIQPAADSPIAVDARVIHSTTGMGASDFAKTMEADLLILPSGENAEGSTQLPVYTDWVSQVVPCSLWLVRVSASPAR